MAEAAELKKDRVAKETLVLMQNRLGRALSSISDIKSAMEVCIDTAIKAAGMDCGGIYQVNEDSSLDLMAHMGLPDSFIKVVNHFEADSPNARLVMEGRPVYTQHQMMGFGTSDNGVEGLRALAVIPIKCEGRVIACLNISSHTLTEVPDRARNALGIISTQIGTALGRIEAENALRDSEEKYRRLVEMSPDGIAVHSGGKIVFVNPAAARIMGVGSADECIGKPLMDFVHPDYRETVKERVRKMNAGELAPLMEEKFLKVDGRAVDVEVAAMPITFNRQPAIQVVFRDVTERRKIREALKESEGKYKAVVENANDGIALVQDYKLVYVNERLAQMIGYGVDELTGARLKKFIHHDELKKVMERYRKRISGEVIRQVYETGLKHKKGFRVDVEFSAVLLTYEGMPASLVIVRDITERKKADEKLRTSEEEFRLTFESTKDAIFWADPETGLITMCNKAAEALLEKRRDEIIGKHQTTIHPPEKAEYFQRIFKKHIRHKGWVDEEAEIITKTGRVVPIQITATATLVGGKPIIQGIFRDITERKATDNAIRESEEKYRMLMETLPQTVLIFIDNRVVFANTASIEMFRCRGMDDVIGKDIMEQIPDAEKKRVRMYIRHRLQGKKDVPKHYFMTLKRLDGGEFPAEIFATRVSYKGHNAIQVVISDITERLKSEEAIRESEKRYRITIDSIKDAMHVADPKLKIILCNKTMTEWTRKLKLKKDIVGHTVFDVFPFLPTKVREEYHQVFKTKSMVVAHDVNKIGNVEMITETRKIPIIESGKVTHVLTVIRDITKEEKTQREVLEIKGHLETILDGISESIVVLDRRYNIVSHNRAFQEWVGGGRTRLIGCKCFEVIHRKETPCRRCIIRDVFRTGRPSESVHYHQTKRGRAYHEANAYPIVRDGDRIDEAIYVFRDVTDRERMKEQLRDNYERLLKVNEELVKLDKMKTEFLSIASHELRTPLTIIKGYAEILSSGDLGKLNEEQKSKLERINSNAEHLNLLVNNILDLTRMDAGELNLRKTRFSMGGLIDEVIGDMGQLALKRRIMLSSKITTKSRIHADRSRIKQLIVNLLDNAIKFTPDGGGVTVSASEGRDVMRVSVSDTGIGIKRNEIGKIFKRFYQVDASSKRKYGGAGLGLAICKRIVELHGGSIGVRSRYKSGTTITVNLPFK
ncbi:MAG: PAS domain S-box protein [Candidatus Altiarchaeota archaeon]